MASILVAHAAETSSGPRTPPSAVPDVPVPLSEAQADVHAEGVAERPGDVSPDDEPPCRLYDLLELDESFVPAPPDVATRRGLEASLSSASLHDADDVRPSDDDVSDDGVQQCASDDDSSDDCSSDYTPAERLPDAEIEAARASLARDPHSLRAKEELDMQRGNKLHQDRLEACIARHNGDLDVRVQAFGPASLSIAGQEAIRFVAYSTKPSPSRQSYYHVVGVDPAASGYLSADRFNAQTAPKAWQAWHKREAEMVAQLKGFDVRPEHLPS